MKRIFALLALLLSGLVASAGALADEPKTAAPAAPAAAPMAAPEKSAAGAAADTATKPAPKHKKRKHKDKVTSKVESGGVTPTTGAKTAPKADESKMAAPAADAKK